LFLPSQDVVFSPCGLMVFQFLVHLLQKNVNEITKRKQKKLGKFLASP